MRVLVPGMGGDLGTRVALRLEAESAVDAICGIDLEPPRRWMRRAEFHFVRPTNAARIAEVVQDFRPTAVAHLWIFEPHSRSTPAEARSRTTVGTHAMFAAIENAGLVDRIVVRSGLEVYGRRRGSPVPSVASPLDPTSRFGRMMTAVEGRAERSGLNLGATVAAVRCASVVGSHSPSPLGRYLRLPAVPVPVIGRPFHLLHPDDAADAIVAALLASFDGPVNVLPSDSITPALALKVGRRLPVPVVGPALRFTGLVTELLGSPLPEHAAELLTRGRPAVTGEAAERLGFEPSYSTAEAVQDLYEWGDVADISAAIIDPPAA